MSVRDDLDKITCTVLVDWKRNHYLIDRWPLQEKLTKDVVVSLKESGLKVVAGGTRNALGGGGESILYILRHLMQIKDYLGFLVAAFKLPASYYARYLRQMAMTQGPAIIIHLVIKSDEDMSAANIYDGLGQRLSVLFIAGYTEAKRLQSKYPMYTFDIKVSAVLPKNGFDASYYMTANQGNFNRNRILAVIRSLKFQEGLGLMVSLNRLGLIEHNFKPQTLIIGSPHRDKDWRFISGTAKKFYTLVSTRMIHGYMKSASTMPYEQFLNDHVRIGFKDKSISDSKVK